MSSHHGAVAPQQSCRTCRQGSSIVLPPHGSSAHHRIGETGVVLLIDAANVIGSRPTGWWRDRSGAARAFVERLGAAVESGLLAEPVVVVLEGAARGGVEAGVAGGVTVLHAPGSGDDTLLAVVADANRQVTLVSADRALRQQAGALGADVTGPRWLLDLLDE